MAIFFRVSPKEFRISIEKKQQCTEIPGIVFRDMVLFLQGYGKNTNNTGNFSIFPIFFF
jgi:hypothetical protein